MDPNLLDTVTGLPKRGHLWSVLDDILIQIKRQETYCGVLLVNIDNMGEISILVGEGNINDFLTLIAARLNKCLWDMDTAVRFDEHQFVIIANSIKRPENIHVVMKKVQEYLTIECEIDGQQINPSITVGITLLPYDSCEVEEIIANANVALQMALANSEVSYYYYNQELGQRIEEREDVKNSILSTLANESFILQLQPKIAVKTGEVRGIEALVRMKDVDGNILPPNDFIPIAESSNLILKIGEWVLEECCALSIEWQNLGINLPISINISDVQLKNSASLLALLHKLSARKDAKPHNIILEISENIISGGETLVSALLTEIKNYGYQVSIDGFGSGFSSLSVLKNLKVDEIKIDRNFLSDVPEDDKSTAIFKSIIMLGQSMDFRVVVMGVEHQAQSDLLKEYGCDEFQGFLISEPLERNKFLEWFKTYQNSH